MQRSIRSKKLAARRQNMIASSRKYQVEGSGFDYFETVKGEGWEKLKKDIRPELDEDALETFHGTLPQPFAAGDNQKIAVEIVDDRGIESLKIVGLD